MLSSRQRGGSCATVYIRVSSLNPEHSFPLPSLLHTASTSRILSSRATLAELSKHRTEKVNPGKVVMIGPALFCFTALVSCNCVAVSGTMFSPLKVDRSSLSVYKPGPRGNEFEYSIGKRGSQDAQESPDSKERRSQMGSSFIRFGRSRYEANLENGDYASGNEYDGASGADASSLSASRIARGRPDIIIRFGRSDGKNFRPGQLTRSEVKSLRNGNNKIIEINDLDQLAAACSNVLANTDVDGNQPALYLSKFLRLCASLGLDVAENDDNRRKSKIIEFLEDASRAESMKHE